MGPEEDMCGVDTCISKGTGGSARTCSSQRQACNEEKVGGPRGWRRKLRMEVRLCSGDWVEFCQRVGQRRAASLWVRLLRQSCLD